MPQASKALPWRRVIMLWGRKRRRKIRAFFTVTANGYGKRTDIVEYLRLSEDGTRYPQNRGGKGLKNYNITAKTGPVVACRVVGDGEDGYSLSLAV